MEDSTQVETQLGPVFRKSEHFFDFQKRAGEASPPTCAPGTQLFASVSTNGNALCK